jgi:hypothetical protein
VSQALPSCVRSVLTEICLCHACSCRVIEDGNAQAGGAIDRAAVIDSAEVELLKADLSRGAEE